MRPTALVVFLAEQAVGKTVHKLHQLGRVNAMHQVGNAATIEGGKNIVLAHNPKAGDRVGFLVVVAGHDEA